MVPVAVSVAMPAAVRLLDDRWRRSGVRLGPWRLVRAGRRLESRSCRLLAVRSRLRAWVDDRVPSRFAVREGEHVPMPHEIVIVCQAVRTGRAGGQEEGHDRQERRQRNEGRDDDETLHETSKGEKSRPPFRR